MACTHLKIMDIEGREVKCIAKSEKECPRSRGHFRIAASCWRNQNKQTTVDKFNKEARSFAHLS